MLGGFLHPYRQDYYCCFFFLLLQNTKHCMLWLMFVFLFVPVRKFFFDRCYSLLTRMFLLCDIHAFGINEKIISVYYVRWNGCVFSIIIIKFPTITARSYLEGNNTLSYLDEISSKISNNQNKFIRNLNYRNMLQYGGKCNWNQQCGLSQKRLF